MTLVVAVVLALFVLSPPWSWIAVGAGAAVEAGETVLWFRWSRRRRAAVGAEALLGRSAVAITDLRPEGQVKIDGEIWRARCSSGASAGDELFVRDVDDLTLVVESTA